MIVPITTHVQDALARLTNLPAGATEPRALVALLAQAVQDIEDVIAQVAQDQLGQGHPLAGAQLDVLGRTVGLARHGLDDATYSALLLGRIGINGSNATTQAILTVAAQVFLAGAVFFADNTAPVHHAQKGAGVYRLALGSPKLSPALYELALGLVRQAATAGVSLSVATSFDAQGAFALAGPQTWAKGFAALDGTGGGALAQLIYTDPKEARYAS